MVMMWGRGREGQLGTGGHADSAAPRPVEELRGRRVVQVRCVHSMEPRVTKMPFRP